MTVSFWELPEVQEVIELTDKRYASNPKSFKEIYKNLFKSSSRREVVIVLT